MHQPITLVPCLHSMCGGCFSNIAKKVKGLEGDELAKSKPNCPVCSKEVQTVNYNAEKASRVDTLLNWFPEKKRDPTDL